MKALNIMTCGAVLVAVLIVVWAVTPVSTYTEQWDQVRHGRSHLLDNDNRTPMGLYDYLIAHPVSFEEGTNRGEWMIPQLAKLDDTAEFQTIMARGDATRRPQIAAQALSSALVPENFEDNTGWRDITFRMPSHYTRYISHSGAEFLYGEGSAEVSNQYIGLTDQMNMNPTGFVRDAEEIPWFADRDRNSLFIDNNRVDPRFTEAWLNQYWTDNQIGEPYRNALPENEPDPRTNIDVLPTWQRHENLRVVVNPDNKVVWSSAWESHYEMSTGGGRLVPGRTGFTTLSGWESLKRVSALEPMYTKSGNPIGSDAFHDEFVIRNYYPDGEDRIGRSYTGMGGTVRPSNNDRLFAAASVTAEEAVPILMEALAMYYGTVSQSGAIGLGIAEAIRSGNTDYNPFD